ncbi:MAG: calcium-binding protein [Methyloceanibacter sp.]|uniref:calcium-binding protein n=1 Tax=Methyloceanibacter sp. TaxID=1965321 RepID=UPI003D6C9766
MATFTRSDVTFFSLWADTLVPNWQLAQLGAIPNDGGQHFYSNNGDGTVTAFYSDPGDLEFNGEPSGGTVTIIQRAKWDGVTLTPLETIENFSHDYVTLYQQALAGTLFEFLLSGDDTVNGGTTGDSLFGYDGADTINGGDGNDTIDGGAGDDNINDSLGFTTTIDGGAGDDFIKIGPTFTSGGTIDGGADTDTLETTAAGTNLSFLQISNVETLRVGFNGGIAFASQFQAFDTIEHTNGTTFQIALTLVESGAPTTLDLTQKVSNPVFVLGTPDGETITGGQSGDTLFGEDGDDTLDGGAGLDFVDGGGGDDTIISKAGEGGNGEQLDGGEDFDDLILDRSNETVAFNFSFADAITNVFFDLGDGTEIRNFERFNFKSGLGDDTITGWDFQDVLNGGAGNDTLNGGDGDDILRGGPGADNLNGGADDDTYQIAGTEGFGDTIADTGGMDSLELVGNAMLATFNSPNLSIEQLIGNGKVLSGTSSGNIFDFSGMTASGVAGFDGRAGNDTIKGSLSDDMLLGYTGNDKLSGGAGKDTLHGGKGKDSLTGGADGDLFDFNSIKESVKGSKRDTITDFKRGQGDKIDLEDIDAKTGVSGNNKFKWIGKQDFHEKKGELRFEDKGSKVIVQGDVNGDGNADFEILVKVGALSSGDFVL